jgi:NAD(P)-dependent dehydrogenase (short-subunit alcohol dehydrogenase family)
MIPNLFDLSGKVAVITGGSRGLGREMSGALAGAGAAVVIASRKLEACVGAAEEIACATGQEALPVEYHAGQWANHERLLELTYKRFGRCDVLVNNAGMSPLYDGLASVTEDLFDKVLAVNLKGPFRLSALFADEMRRTETGGSIVNVSSIAAVQPTANELVYACAKAALNTLTVGLARTYGPEVRSNAIMAGPFFTDVSQAWDRAKFDAMASKRIPLRRGGEPHEVVGTALYLASAASSYTTGAVIKVDGGAAYAPA